MAKRMTVVFADEDLYTAIKVEAARRHTPAKDVVADAMRQWLKIQEELDDIEAAKHEIEDYEKGGAVPLDDVLKERGLTA